MVPQIPNFTLMVYFGAHGMRHGVSAQGGGPNTAAWLNVETIPGRWKEAMSTPEVKQLFSKGLLGDNLKGAVATEGTVRFTRAHRVPQPRRWRFRGGWLAALANSDAMKERSTYMIFIYHYCRSLLSKQQVAPKRGRVTSPFLAQLPRVNRESSISTASGVVR